MFKQIAIVAAALLLLVLPAAAQDDEALSFVAQAMENFDSVESYSFEVETSLRQNISTGSGSSAFTLDQEITQSMSGVSDLTTGNLSAELDQDVSVNNNGQRLDAQMNISMIILDGVIYMRFADLSENIATLFPEGWVNFSEDGSSIPGASMLDPQGLVQMASVSTLYPINEHTVTEITELESEEIDGETMRVFALVFDVEAVFAEAGDSILGMMNTESMGAEVEAMLDAMVEGMALELKIWISEASEHIYRIEGSNLISTILPASVMGGVEASFDQDTSSAITITGYDVSVEIEAPEIE